jgi:hypothetical protein
MVILLTAGLGLSLAAPAFGAAVKKGTHPFKPGIDISSWYWNRQIDQEVTTPPGVTLPPPAPPVSQRVRLPSPQRPDTIPVALNNGEVERMAAVKFEVTERGVTEGSTIKKFVITIQESADRNEHPSFRADAAKIQACRVTDGLVPGENEQFKDAPKFAEDDCVDGTRDAAATPAPTWTFDLSKIAEPWGKNPFDNNGVMLVPVKGAGGPSDSFQVNLKVPALDDAATADRDEYEETKNRAVLELEFTPGAPLDAGTTGTDTTTPTTTTGTTATTGVTGTGGSPVIGSPSTDLTGTGSIPGAAPTTAPTEQAGLSTPVDQEPRIPAYVWLAIPLGLLALSAVRSVVLEPTGGPRPDGVIAAIRRRNAERRGGGDARDAQNALSRMAGSFRRGATSTRKSFSNLVRRKR